MANNHHMQQLHSNTVRGNIKSTIFFVVTTTMMISSLTTAQQPDPIAVQTFLEHFQPEFDSINSNPASQGLFGATYVAVSHP